MSSIVRKFKGTNRIEYNGKNYKSSTPVYESMLQLGVPVAVIARKLQVTYPAVLAYKQTQEDKGRTYPRVTNQLDAAYWRAAFAVALAKDKWSRKRIAQAFKMTYAAVAFMLKSACVKVPDLRKVQNKRLRKADNKKLCVVRA